MAAAVLVVLAAVGGAVWAVKDADARVGRAEQAAAAAKREASTTADAASEPVAATTTVSSSTSTAPSGELPSGHPQVGGEQTATGLEPEAHVKAYYGAILAGKWQTAFDLQPEASKAGGSAAAFKETQKMYGMVSFEVTDRQVTTDIAVITVTQDLGANGLWKAAWTFEREGGAWIVKTRKVSMGG